MYFKALRVKFRIVLKYACLKYKCSIKMSIIIFKFFEIGKNTKHVYEQFKKNYCHVLPPYWHLNS